MKGASVPVLFLFFFLFSSPVFSTTIHVPSDYPTIQDAINNSVDGDTILVSPGTYFENIYFIGKNVTVQSTDGPDLTIIDGSQLDTTVTFQNGESSGAVLEGFTITNGRPMSGNGGGIKCSGAHPTIKNNVIKGNPSQNGAGIYLYHSSPDIHNNLIIGNYASSYGGGIYCDHSSSPQISCTTIAVNSAPTGGGLYAYDYSHPKAINSIIWDNCGGGVTCEWYSSAEIKYTDIQGGWSDIGDIDEDPLFYDPDNKDFHLKQDPCQPGVFNPCKDAGKGTAFENKVDALWTRTDGVPDTGKVDMGFHYNSPGAQGGDTIEVPKDFQKIQDAIDAATTGDTVCAADAPLLLKD